MSGAKDTSQANNARMRDRIGSFFENFGKPPEHERPPLIPQRLRMPVFAAAALVSLVLLVLLVWLVVVPGIRAQQRVQPHSERPAAFVPQA